MKNKFKNIFAKAKESIPEIEEKWKFDPNDPRKFFFMHIPKTAGTSFRKILYQHAPPNYLWPSQKFLRENENGYPTLQELLSNYKNELNKKIIIGHYNFDLIQHLPNDVFVLTFLRNPYDRVLSHIKHMCALDNKFQNNPNLVVENNFKQIISVQSKMLRFQPPNKKGFETMQANIERINFVGITEEFDKSIQLCNTMFNWNLENIKPQNQRPNKQLEMLTEINKSKIIQAIIPEIRTYKVAYSKFNALCKQYQLS